MDRLLASFLLLLSCVQVETLFAGAYQVSLRTDWQRLSHYAQREIRLLTQQATTKTSAPAPAQPPPKTIFIDSATPEDERRQASFRQIRER